MLHDQNYENNILMDMIVSISPIVQLYSVSVYHWLEVNVRLRVMGLRKGITTTKVEKLNEESAVNLGAEILGEFTTYSICALILALEMNRQGIKKEKLELEDEQNLLDLTKKIKVCVMLS